MLCARSDVSHVAISVDAGGCGASHSRPVTNGAPEEVWKLNCPQCESFLRGDPLWSATEAEIPETYDEQTRREDEEKRGNRAREKARETLDVRMVDMMELMSKRSAQEAGVDPELIARLVQEQVAKVLAEKQISPPEPEPESEPEPELDLDKLHWKTLQKMCKQKGLPETGSREDLVKRLKSV
jgi:hypothetical protein